MNLISKVNKNISVIFLNVINGDYDIYNDDSFHLVKGKEYNCEEFIDGWVRIYFNFDVYICIRYYEKATYFYTGQELRKIKLDSLKDKEVI